MDFEGVSSDVHEFFGKSDSDLFFIIFLLHDTVVAVVVGADVCAEGVDEAILRTAGVRGVGGEECGGATHTEETVHEQHRRVVSPIHA